MAHTPAMGDIDPSYSFAGLTDLPKPSAPSGDPLALIGHPGAGTGNKPKGGGRGRRLRDIQAAPMMIPDRPAGGFEAYLDDEAGRKIGNRRVGPGGVRWRGGTSPEKAVARATQDYEGLSDDEKDYWTRRANMDTLRGPEDRARMAAYEDARAGALGGRSGRAGRGRPLSQIAANTDGGSGFTGTRSRGIAMRTPEQIAARVANSPVTGAKPVATIRSSGFSDQQSREYWSRVNPDGTLSTGEYRPAQPKALAVSPKGRPLSETFDPA